MLSSKKVESGLKLHFKMSTNIWVLLHNESNGSIVCLGITQWLKD